ncbi:MAG: hypothetical protein JRJ59_00375, partial [Deltaproteobacteria bacterium]|nr:hypothetical protein [Deltaproteobacteria bacterium]
MTKVEKEMGGPQEAALRALAYPDDERATVQVEEDLELTPGTVAEWLRTDPVFRSRLEKALQPGRHLLTRLSVLKSLAAKAKEG